MFDNKEKYLNNFSYKPTKNQIEFFEHIDQFLQDFTKPEIFVLSGYAGTGKTSVVSALVKTLPSMKKRSVLLAPTGRAAKVLSQYTQRKAFTIHKKIYTLSLETDTFTPSENNHKNTLFVVDEASMIPSYQASSGSEIFAYRNLLDDLITYVFSGYNCKLLFIGDPAQLPPVGTNLSPALDASYLNATYSMEIHEHSLTQVVRQEMESGILANATFVRKQIEKDKFVGKLFKTDGYPDIVRIDGSELEELLIDSYSKVGEDEVSFITTSNKRANLLNQSIRNRILYRDSELNAGDLLMITRNNYFWLPSKAGMGFLANGDIVRINRIVKYHDMYDFRFADCEMEIVDSENTNRFEARILIDSLHSEASSISTADYQKLQESIRQDYQHIQSERYGAIGLKTDPWMQALQVKFAYAYTCHKSQGGQWNTVFVDQGYITKERLNIEYLRWLYTALTRATKKLYLVNFHEDFFI
ncbi:MAG: ATP-dependent DNA helicase [Bacteroidales bacterium]|nr:AAA family ATPase [Bacteroidales bacterium]